MEMPIEVTNRLVEKQPFLAGILVVVHNNTYKICSRFDNMLQVIHIILCFIHCITYCWFATMLYYDMYILYYSIYIDELQDEMKLVYL